MKKLEYKEFKKEYIKDFFNKVFKENYRILILKGNDYYFFAEENDFIYDTIIDVVVFNGKFDYDYEDFEELINDKKFKKYIIDEEKKFIVIVS